jgi:hypothetical protein
VYCYTAIQQAVYIRLFVAKAIKWQVCAKSGSANEKGLLLCLSIVSTGKCWTRIEFVMLMEDFGALYFHLWGRKITWPKCYVNGKY